ncbi:RagB/SusD family nutrient uptake outer membrane protein [Aequorivita sp. H23M31]|uniref:RagB/SusD family nutrient uptake outer membrane protein n=1 Tax=Aequorivita ciconiae TaxID=2494375 RepID=A0A410G447_9FLAO|nr:RagB/SusD family nutrient uptake outer membrane protein [Aequorivita sp. H23M31]QAA82047.1 RagB/SusD family nutrient uptake outer membrane protein [Aequorivita sp. H23M31]
MKKYINTFSKLFIVALAFSISGCSIDDIKPIDKLTSENTIRDEASAQAVLNGVYDLVRADEVTAYPLYLAAFGDEGVITGRLAGGSSFNTNEVNVENRYLANLYNGQYKIINAANFLIQELEAGKAIDISDERKGEMISEAKFQRAFAYFNLLRFFGQYYDMNSAYGVVLRTEFATRLAADPRSTVQETYNLIVSDLEYAMENGPLYVEHFYSGSLAAKALLAKVKLYTGEYGESARLAEEVIYNGEGYELEASYSDIFANQYNSSEVIFAHYAGPGAEGGSNMYQISNTSYSEYLRGLADEQVEGTGSLSGNGSNYDPRFSYAYSATTKGVNQQGKYPFASNLSSPNNTTYFLRMAEMYLIHAEAVVRSGGDTSLALESLNTIRERAELEDKTFSDVPTLLEDIRQEKLLELFYENGEPLYDLVRYDILGNLDASTIKPTMNTKDVYILPIPSEVIIGNNKVVQNPGY